MFKKFLLLFAFLFTFQFSLFAVGGNVFHGGKVSVIHTQYFDIIFGDDCFDSAKKIASVADEYYAEISQKLGTVPYQRFPVTITREVESSNGFFSPAPFNMIVLYESFDKSPMDYSSGGIASVFYHELTHAVTLNCKSKVFRVLSAIFGDFFNPAGLSMSYFWIEGSAVLFESAGGEGRLNNPFFTQIVTQAKIESVNGGKKFPSWRDVAGARDSFPGGTDRYAFGGCFADYLVQTYGTEKYAELWKNAGTSTSLSFVAGVFKKTYGKKLDEVWSDFEASIQIPEVSDSEKSQKIEANLISDKSSIIRAFDAFYDASEKSVKIAFYDGKSGWVYLAQNGNVKKLFFADGTNHLRFSPDGKKLAVTRLVSRKNEKSEAGVYDFDLKCYTVVKKSGARDAYFDFGKDGYQLSYLTLENTQPSVENSPVCIQKSLSAKIVKTGLNWSIALENDSETIEFSSEKMLQKLHLVSATDKKLLLSFVWAPKGKNLSSVSKLGLFEYDLESKKGEFLYQKDAVCVNGIVSGVTDGFIVMNEDSLNATSNCLLYFVSSEYEKNPLYKTEISLENFERVEAVFAKHEIETENIEAGFSENKKNNFTAEKFSSLPYYLKGLRLPLGIVPVYETDFSEKSRALLGVTYASSNPWLDNLLILSAGYDFSTNSYGTFFNLRGNDLQTSYQISGTCIFDSEGFKQTVDSAVFSRKLYNGRLWKLNSGLSSQIFYGREENQRVTVLDTREIEEGIVYETDFRKKGFFSNSTGFLSISNVHKFSQKSNNFAGITIQPFIKFQWDDYNLDFSKVNHKIPQKDEYLNLGLSLLARVPFVFPLSFQADLFPEKNYFADAYAKVYIHSWEIQKGIPAVSIFLNRITLSASYTGLFAYDHEKYWDALRTAEIAEKFSFDDYSDRISLNLNFELCPNTGYLADPACQFVIGGVMVFRPNPKPGEARTAFGITGSLNL